MLIICVDQLDGSEVLLQIDFEMIRVATNDFSDENKLGEGGFGPVYKVITNYFIKKETNPVMLKVWCCWQLKADLTSMLPLLFGTNCSYLTNKLAQVSLQ